MKLKHYLYLLAGIIYAIMLGAVLPALFSAPSTMAVMAAIGLIIILIVLPINFYLKNK